MVLEWHESNVAGVRVTHWQKESAPSIVNAISSKPVRVVETLNGPAIHVYAYGKHELAVRTYREPAKSIDVFNTLKKSVEEKAALTEVPFAKIRDKNNDVSVVTLWKKGTRTLHEYLDDLNVGLDAKKITCKRVVRLVAKLHAAGYSHGHVHARNILLYKNNQPVLCDPRLLIQRDQSLKFWPWESRKKDFTWSMGVGGEKFDLFEYCGKWVTYHLNRLAFTSIDRREAIVNGKSFERELEQHYHDHYDKLVNSRN